MTRLSISFVVALSLTALAEEKKLVGTKKEGAPKLDLGLPTFKEVPKDQQLRKAGPAAEQNAPSAHGDESYTVVRVVHGKSFTRTPEGSKPTTPFTQVTLSGNPLVSEKFSTVVRIKSPTRRSTRIALAILDARGESIMEAPQGELGFGKTGGDEAEWSVDWDSSPIRAAGDYQLQVSVGGAVLGTFPIKFAETPK